MHESKAYGDWEWRPRARPGAYITGLWGECRVGELKGASNPCVWVYVNLHTLGRGRLEGEKQAVCEALYSYFLQQRDVSTYRIQIKLLINIHCCLKTTYTTWHFFAAPFDNRGRAVEISDSNYFGNLQVLMMITCLQLLYKPKNVKL